ncbi:tetratricopeptide repeat protein [Bacillus testis]|uniref:tetratricopeptide repeat protein n=1 Tax=Bacillus testis TaxID=1622072 RepID=UPI00067EAA8D|nr:tetratricopeptide repeat protein [Bacillus testis]
MDKKKGRGKVIPFPGLERKLIDRGMEAIADKRFEEASTLLIQALEMDEEDYNARFGLILAFVELGRYKEAKQHCKFILHKGLGDYLKTIEMYIMILIQLHEYDEMESLISALLDERQIPFDKEEHFNSLLEFSRKMAGHAESGELEEEAEEAEEEWLLDVPFPEQMLIIQRWKEQNIRKHIPAIRAYLQAEEGHPFIKTVLLSLLKEQEVQEEFVVHKFSEEETYIPSALEDIQERPFFKHVSARIENVLGSEDPSLAQLACQLLERQQFILYPMEPKGSFGDYAAAYHIMARIYFGKEAATAKIAALYGCGTVEVESALQFIEKIEEISSV